MKSLKPVEKIYHFFVGAKNFLYDHNFVKPIKLKTPVVSIGNISFGGVGKTPFVILLSEALLHEFKINIVTRSYKASLTEPKKVSLELPAAPALFGDEACLIQTKLPACSVWSGPNKTSTAAASLINQPDLILLDDGFSHRKLHRNFDLVLIDATEGMTPYMRESVQNLKRAHAVLITKANLSTAAAISGIEEKIISIAPNLKNNIFTSNVLTTLPVEKTEPLYVFCGLGRPETFILDLAGQGYNIVHTDFYSDHFSYSAAEQKNIYNKYLEYKKKYTQLKIVTSEKDFIKIQDAELRKTLVVADHRITMELKSKEVLIEKIRQAL